MQHITSQFNNSKHVKQKEGKSAMMEDTAIKQIAKGRKILCPLLLQNDLTKCIKHPLPKEKHNLRTICNISQQFVVYIFVC